MPFPSLLVLRLFMVYLFITTLSFSFQNSLGITDSDLYAGEFLFEDNFDDQNLTTNNKGQGSGWNVGNNKSIATERDGVAEISIHKEHKSVRLQSKDSDEFYFWNDSGVTVTWTLKDTKILTPHKFGVWAAFHWNLGVISANASNTGWNHIGGNEKGGFYVNIGHLAASKNATAFVFVSNKHLVSNPEPHAGDKGFALLTKKTFESYDGKTPLVVTANLSKNQWQVSFNQVFLDQSTGMSGNWTSDISDGNKLRAPITDEFNNGAFLLTMARNSGIDNSYKEYPPNSGQIDKVTVKINSK